MQISLDFIEERGQRIGALLTMRDAESVRRIEDEIELSRRLAAIGRQLNNERCVTRRGNPQIQRQAANSL